MESKYEQEKQMVKDLMDQARNRGYSPTQSYYSPLPLIVRTSDKEWDAALVAAGAGLPLALAMGCTIQ